MSGSRTATPLAIRAGLLVLGVLLVACSPSSPPPAAKPAPDASSPMPHPPALWGDMKSVVSVKALMRDMIDPAGDFIFNAVSTVVSRKGTIEKFPKTDEDWDRIRFGAVTLAEGAYLLKVPRPFATPEEDKGHTADSSELPAPQIEAKRAADPVLWDAKIEALRNVGLEVLEIVKTRDVKELWEAGANLDQACEACHIEYWYPGEKGLFEKLDRRLQEFNATPLRPDRSGRGR